MSLQPFVNETVFTELNSPWQSTQWNGNLGLSPLLQDFCGFLPIFFFNFFSYENLQENFFKQ